MKFKLIMALVQNEKTEAITEAARTCGATGCTVITSARGEGLEPGKTFFGLDLSGQRDLLIFLVADQRSRDILETIAKTGDFEGKSGAGIAFQLGIEDAIGLSSQMETLSHEIEDQI